MPPDLSESESQPHVSNAETLKPPTAWYITEKFVEQAPNNVDDLHTYIGDHLLNEVRSQVAAPLEFWPPALKQVLGKSEGARETIQEMIDDKTNMIRRALEQYDRYRFILYRQQNPRPGEEEPRKPERLSVEQVTERLKATEVMLFWLELGQERKVIDYLYEKAGAIPVQGIETDKIGTLPALPDQAK